MILFLDIVSAVHILNVGFYLFFSINNNNNNNSIVATLCFASSYVTCSKWSGRRTADTSPRHLQQTHATLYINMTYTYNNTVHTIITFHINHNYTTTAVIISAENYSTNK